MRLRRETREPPVGFSTVEAINTTNGRLRHHQRAAPGLQGLKCNAPRIAGQLAAWRVLLSGRIAKLQVPAASTDGRFNQKGERWLEIEHLGMLSACTRVSGWWNRGRLSSKQWVNAVDFLLHLKTLSNWDHALIKTNKQTKIPRQI